MKRALGRVAADRCGAGGASPRAGEVVVPGAGRVAARGSTDGSASSHTCLAAPSTAKRITCRPGSMSTRAPFGAAPVALAVAPISQNIPTIAPTTFPRRPLIKRPFPGGRDAAGYRSDCLRHDIITASFTTPLHSPWASTTAASFAFPAPGALLPHQAAVGRWRLSCPPGAAAREAAR